MKKLYQLLMIFAAVFFQAQTLNAEFAINRPSDAKDNFSQRTVSLISYENELSPAQIISYFLQENIDVTTLEGSGRQTTVLTIDFNAAGVLENVKANGENTGLNNAAAKALQAYIGKPTRLKSPGGQKVKLIIPISVNL